MPGSTRCASSVATLFADRFEDVRLLVPYDEGTALSALYALGAPIDERRDTDAGVLIRAKLSHRDTRRFAQLPRRWRRPGVRRDDDMTDLRVIGQKLRDDAVLPTRANLATRASTSPPARPSRSRPGERAMVGTGLAVEIPAGHAGLVVPRSGLALRNGLSLVNTPGVIDAGYRGEVRVILLNTDREHSVHRRGGDAHRPTARRPGASQSRSSRSRELTGTERGAGGFGSSGVR